MQRFSRMKLTKAELIVGNIQRCLTYNMVELGLTIGLLVGYFNGGVWPLVLWAGFVAAVTWIVATSQTYAQQFAKEQVLDRELFIMDFVSATIILCVLAWIVRHEQWYFPAMFLLAAAQNLRYTYLSTGWLLAEARESKPPTED